jgi:glycosyltransferase involved in cell wall biosynthesis
VYRIRPSFKLSNTPFSFFWFPKVRRIIKQIEPDIVNIHTPVPGLGDVVALMCGQRPLIVTYHAGSMKKHRFFADIIIWLYEHGLMRLLLHRANRIICSSEFVRTGFLARYAHKATVITPGVDTNRFTPRSAAPTLYPEILFVAGLGTAEQHKGLSILLSVIAKLRTRIADIHLTVVGDGDMRSRYEAEANALGIATNVTFKGKLDGTALVEAYQQAQVFALPTTNDSSPTVIIEAMACGLAVVSTRVGGIPDIVEEAKTGYLVPSNDGSALSDRIEALILDRSRCQELGSAGREKVRRVYEWKERVDRYAQILDAASKPSIFLIGTYYPPHLGGIEQVMEHMAIRLAARDRTVTVLTSSEEMWGSIERKQNLTIRRLFALDIANLRIAPALLFHLFCIPQGSIVHVHLAQAFWPEMVLVASIIKRMRYIAHFHLDVMPSGTFGQLFLLHKRLIWGRFLRRASEVIVCAAEQVDIVSSLYGVSSERIRIIPNAVSELFFTDVTSSRTSGQTLRLLYVGRLAPQKRVDRIIEALSLLSIPYMLTLIGDGEEYDALVELARKRKISAVTFLGTQTHEEVRNAYRTHDALIISSDREGMPLTVLEAMASGLPIIATDVVGLRDLVADVGILVREPYVTGIAAAIMELYQTPCARLQYSVRSRENARSYTWNRYLERLDQVYKKFASA